MQVPAGLMLATLAECGWLRLKVGLLGWSEVVVGEGFWPPNLVRRVLPGASWLAGADLRHRPLRDQSQGVRHETGETGIRL